MEVSPPLDLDVVKKMRAGDTVYLSGEIITARDKAHARIVEYLDKGRELPFELDGTVIYHCGPLIVRDNGWRIVSAGPTTSARMNPFAPKILEHVSSIAFIGKGGMGEETLKAMEGKAVYLAYTGGAGAMAAESIKDVRKIIWEDLSPPEAVWVLEVERFGPCIVAMDSHSKSLFTEVEKRAREKFREIFG